MRTVATVSVAVRVRPLLAHELRESEYICDIDYTKKVRFTVGAPPFPSPTQHALARHRFSPSKTRRMQTGTRWMCCIGPMSETFRHPTPTGKLRAALRPATPVRPCPPPRAVPAHLRPRAWQQHSLQEDRARPSETCTRRLQRDYFRLRRHRFRKDSHDAGLRGKARCCASPHPHTYTTHYHHHPPQTHFPCVWAQA